MAKTVQDLVQHRESTTTVQGRVVQSWVKITQG